MHKHLGFCSKTLPSYVHNYYSFCEKAFALLLASVETYSLTMSHHITNYLAAHLELGVVWPKKPQSLACTAALYFQMEVVYKNQT